MRLMKIFWLAALVLCSASFALADGVDPLVGATRGPVGSTGLTESFSVTGTNVPIDTNCVYPGTTTQEQCFEVPSGETLTAVSYVEPDAFTGAFPLFCGISNAFVDGGPTVSDKNYFLPTDDGTNSTCSYAAYTGLTPPPDTPPAGSNDELDAFCLASNTFNNPTGSQYCIGITNGDLYVPVLDGNGNPVVIPPGIISGAATLVPEPGSFAMLFSGLAGLFMYRRRRLA